MRLLAFFVAAGVYAVVAYSIYAAILFQCGLGPDSSVGCNDAADGQASRFAVGALTFFAVLAFAYWRQWPKLKG